MMTEANWKEVEKAFSGMYGIVTLLVDGREITFKRGLVGKSTLGTGVFVDGQLKGEWAGAKNDHTEQRYLYPKEIYVYTAKSRAAMKKLSPRLRKMYGYSLGQEDKKEINYTPFWPSAASVKRHYSKEFASIELIAATGGR